MSHFSRWTSIKKLSSMLASAKKCRDVCGVLDELDGQVLLRGKVKLHGTNVGIGMEAKAGGWLMAQGRNRELTTERDQDGFMEWFGEHERYWRAVQERCSSEEVEEVRVFGEWCGKGIMKKAAITAIPCRCYCVFAVKLDSHMVIEPADIRRILGFPATDAGSSTTDSLAGEQCDALCPPEALHVLPWLTRPLECDLRTAMLCGTLREVDEISAMVEEVDRRDPWVHEVFGVDGPGEGIVFYPCYPPTSSCAHEVVLGERVTVRAFSMVTHLMFKGKGESHLVVKQARPVQVRVEVPASVPLFVDAFVTEGRLEQGVEEACEGNFETGLIGAFVRWVVADVEKESEAEREAGGDDLKWDRLKRLVAKRASSWYRARVPEITAGD